MIYNCNYVILWLCLISWFLFILIILFVLKGYRVYISVGPMMSLLHAVMILCEAIRRLYVAARRLYEAIRKMYVAARRLYEAIRKMYVAARRLRGN